MGEHKEDSQKHGADQGKDAGTGGKMDPERKGGQTPGVGGQVGNTWSQQKDQQGKGEKDTSGKDADKDGKKDANREKNPRGEEDTTR